MEAAEWTKDEQEFFRQIEDSPAGVVISTAFYPDGSQSQAAFSSFEKAHSWAESLPEQVSALHVPYMVDDPEWGNRRTQ